MKVTRLTLATVMVVVVVLGTVAVGAAQMDDDGMEDDSMEGEGMNDGSMDDGEMESDSMEDGTDDGMDGSMDSMDDSTGDSTTFTVRIENVAPTDFYASDSSTGGQVWVTPGAYAVHTHSNPFFTEGESASVGLEAQAEAGPPTGFEGQPGLVDELGGATDVASSGAFTPENTVSDPNDPTGEAPGAPPIAPGGSFEFEVEATQGQHLSFATMFVPSNDLFFAPGSGGIALWEDGEPVSGDVTDELVLWDAGTETNQEPGFGSDQAPAQSEPNQGDDEGGVVRPVSEVGDGFDYPSVGDSIRVTVTPQDGMGDGMDEDMDDSSMDDGEMDGDGMDEGMDDGTDDGMEDSMSEDEMEGDSMNNDSMEDEEMEEEDGEAGGESLPGFGATAAGAAVLLSLVVMYAMREK